MKKRSGMKVKSVRDKTEAVEFTKSINEKNGEGGEKV